MNSEALTVEAYEAKLIELRRKFLFPVAADAAIAGVEGCHHRQHESWKAETTRKIEECKTGHWADQNRRELAREPEYLAIMRHEIVKAVERRLWKATEQMQTFPRRHVENLRTAIESGHSDWRSKLDNVIERLGNGSIFILTGPRGTGKTQLAIAVARYRMERDGEPTTYAVLGDVFTKIKGTFKESNGESEDSITGNLARVPLLVLDEVHEIGGTEWQGRILTLLIDARYREKRDSILITNHAPDDFLASVGESVADRIHEAGFILDCDWPSFRRAQR